jgi:hypothetical protein
VASFSLWTTSGPDDHKARPPVSTSGLPSLLGEDSDSLMTNVRVRIAVGFRFPTDVWIAVGVPINVNVLIRLDVPIAVSRRLSLGQHDSRTERE